MALGLEMELDLEGMDDQQVESGGRLPLGWNHVRVEDVYPDPKNPCMVFEFKGASSKGTGLVQFERLYDPESADDAKKAATSRNRMVLFAKRLGLVKTDDFGKKKSVNWSEAIGKECFVEIAKRSYTDDKGNDKETTQVKFDGIYPTNDDRVPAEVRKAAGFGGGEAAGGAPVPAPSNGPTPAPVGAAAAAAAPNIDDF